MMEAITDNAQVQEVGSAFGAVFGEDYRFRRSWLEQTGNLVVPIPTEELSLNDWVQCVGRFFSTRGSSYLFAKSFIDFIGDDSLFRSNPSVDSLLSLERAFQNRSHGIIDSTGQVAVAYFQPEGYGLLAGPKSLVEVAVSGSVQKAIGDFQQWMEDRREDERSYAYFRDVMSYYGIGNSRLEQHDPIRK
jgi:hypothetical protein